jgi:hypothetical protein
VDVVGFYRSFSTSKIKSRPAIGSELSLSVGEELPRLPSPFNEGTGRFRVARLLEQVHRIDERLYHPEREREPTKAHASASCDTVLSPCGFESATATSPLCAGRRERVVPISELVFGTLTQNRSSLEPARRSLRTALPLC